MIEREKIIRNYLEGYNQFNIEKMISDFDETIIFENIQQGTLTMSLNGLRAFKEQAEQVKHYFTSRTQTITSLVHRPNETEINIDYNAVLALDFPNGMKKGDTIRLQGKSIFHFTNGKIIKLVDIS